MRNLRGRLGRSGKAGGAGAARADDRDPAPPRPGQRRLPLRAGYWPGHAAPRHRRPRDRRPADRQRGRQRGRRVQRRDLQPRRAAGRARGGRPSLPHRVRRRGDRPSLRGARHRLPRAPARHVRAGLVGRAPPAAAARARPARHQAAALRDHAGRPPLRFGAEGAVRLRRGRAATRRAGAGPGLLPRADHRRAHLRGRRPPAAAGALARLERRPRGDPLVLGRRAFRRATTTIGAPPPTTGRRACATSSRRASGCTCAATCRSAPGFPPASTPAPSPR